MRLVCPGLSGHWLKVDNVRARNVHEPDQMTLPESFKREAVDQVLADTPRRHVAETLGIPESLLGKWKRQYEQQGNDTFPCNGKQRGESAELRRLRQQLAQVTKKKRSPSSRSSRSEVPRHRGVGRSFTS